MLVPRYFDVDRHGHILPEVSQRLEHTMRYFDGTAPGIDARINVGVGAD